MRSFLFVPGDSERKLAKGETSAADALVLDLEDAVSADRIEIARKMGARIPAQPSRSHSHSAVGPNQSIVD